MHDCSMIVVVGTNTIRKIVIEYALLAAVYLEPLSDHISTTVQDIELLLISDQPINNGFFNRF
jgi:hypothetical protein